MQVQGEHTNVELKYRVDISLYVGLGLTIKRYEV